MDELSLTPYYNEDVLYSEEELKKENEDGITTLFYLQKIYPNILSGYRTSDNHKDLREGSQALADLKFIYIVCQRYGAQKKSSEARDRSCYSNILNVMLAYPSLRVAYIDQREEPVDGKCGKNYYSVLVKGGEKLDEETSFVTIGQRILANPLMVRFHYGHPDIFDRIFHITRGGISKASKIINLSEDIFSGYNSTLRGGYITHHEYIQVGKGRDVGMNQISPFEAKVANGNGEQTLSRDVYRLGRRFDFYRMLSFYFTTVCFYFSSMVTVLTVYVFLYGRLYLVLNGMEK
ncbi:Callose synthase 7 [Camellia lanceoleosa]|uniref:Callose synthase 7 n=1 Tax=Camellia lanceoleosa TaxID=1840588 RepID=A0ACC0J0V2_9ERIC|nr:Callose synthase 7 [Camellia lanceoleosa]